MKYSPASLQNFCLHTLIKYLECYPNELLACLPPTLRRLLLANVPIVDLCQLENTCVFDGVDAEAIWNEKHDDQAEKYFSFVNKSNRPTSVYQCDRFHYPFLAGESSSREPILSKTKRQRYLDTIIYAVCERARPVGYFRCNTSTDEKTLGDIDLRKYGLLDFPVDIVNYLVAAVRLDSVQFTREPSDETYDNLNNVNLNVSKTEYEVTCGFETPIDRSTYINANKLYQYVPPRYSSYLNKENDYRLSDEDALTLLMDECNYNPEEVYITVHRFASIEWNWGQRIVKALIGKVYSKTHRFELRLGPIYERATETLEQLLKAITSSSNENCSLSITDAVDEQVLIVANYLGQPNSPCVLDKLGIDCIYTPEASCALAAILDSQTKVSCLRIDDALTRTDISTTQSQLYSAIEAFLLQAEFREFSLCIVLDKMMNYEDIQRLVLAYLTAPCSHDQTVELTIKSSRIRSFDQLPDTESGLSYNHKLSVPESALVHKCLKVESVLVSPTKENFVEWLFSLQPLKLKALHFSSESTFNESLLVKLASNPTLSIRSLQLNETDFSAEAFHTLLENESLQELVIELVQDVNLSDITLGLLEQGKKGTLQVLKLLKTAGPLARDLSKTDYRGVVKQVNATNTQHFGDSLFSLPQLNQFTFEVSVFFDQPSDIAPFVNQLFLSWKKQNKEHKLLKFTIDFVFSSQLKDNFDDVDVDAFVDDEVKTIADEMGLQLYSYEIFPKWI